MDKYNLDRFLQAQEKTYQYALSELQAGRKRSHWMWYIFPQMRGLGHSYMSNYYAISGIEEAKAYLENPILNQRLREVCETLLALDTHDAGAIFGGIDRLKLMSSMTLFDMVAPDDVYSQVLDKFFEGKRCKRTQRLIGMTIE